MFKFTLNGLPRDLIQWPILLILDCILFLAVFLNNFVKIWFKNMLFSMFKLIAQGKANSVLMQYFFVCTSF